MIKIKSIEVDIEKLILDPNNPRFARHVDQMIDDSKAESLENLTFEKMLEEVDVESLAQNILKNGFLGFDRLFVRAYKDKFIVVEGNRRVSAIKLLLKKEESGERKDIINPEIKQTFKTLPAIDVTELSDDEVQRMLGLRHFDSVKDWKPLTEALHIFKAYMKEQIGEYEGDIDQVADQFLLDNRIISKLSDQYALKRSAVVKQVQIYRLYLQILEEHPRAINFNNFYSMLNDCLKSITIQHFGIDIQKAVFSTTGMELFVKLFIGEEGKQPIITEVSKGDSAFREYAKVLKEGTIQDIARIEEEREQAARVWANVKDRQMVEGIRQIVSRIEKDLGKLTIDKINIEELTNGDIDVLKKLQKNLDRVIKAL